MTVFDLAAFSVMAVNDCASSRATSTPQRLTPRSCAVLLDIRSVKVMSKLFVYVILLLLRAESSLTVSAAQLEGWKALYDAFNMPSSAKCADSAYRYDTCMCSSVTCRGTDLTEVYVIVVFFFVRL